MSAAADAVMGTLATLLALRRDIHTNSFIFADSSGDQNAGPPVAKANKLDYLAISRDIRASRPAHSASQNVSVSLPRIRARPHANR
jgi:hypothetical protein